MIFYKLKFHSFPTIEFAGTAYTDHYKNIISHRQNIIEIGICNGSDIRYTSGEENFLRQSMSFSSIFPDMDFRMEATSNAPLYMSFAAITGDFSYEKYDTEKIENLPAFLEKSKKDILFPRNFSIDTNYTETERLFRLLIIQHLKETAEGTLRAIALWFEIAASISSMFRQSLIEEKSFSQGEYYSRKAKRYIEAHYGEKISVKALSDMLHITPNYLSHVFKNSTGKTISEFIALTRLYHARRLAYNKTLTFKQIAAEVGICDVYYLNRLFHKYYGTSLYSCRLADHEISFYHDKPWDVEDLTEDIYKQ